MKTNLVRFPVYVLLAISLLIGPFGSISVHSAPVDAVSDAETVVNPEQPEQAEKNIASGN